MKGVLLLESHLLELGLHQHELVLLLLEAGRVSLWETTSSGGLSDCMVLHQSMVQPVFSS